jgi:hypothetical protein
VNKQSNHPPGILKNIAKGINKRLSTISSNEDIFNKAAPEYQEALNKAGHDYKLKYEPEANKPKQTNSKNRNRKRKIILFNPPYSTSVKTRVGQKFLELLDKCFPKNGPLGKLFNRNTVKISYRTTPNLQQIISGHNKKIISKNTDKPQARPCSCPKGTTCPLEAKCLSENLIYQATVTETTKENQQIVEKYVGLSAPPFKKRLGNHIKSFKNENYSTETTLSTHIWNIKQRGSTYTVQWSVLDRGNTYNPATKTCNLCTKEKFYIILKPHLATINKRNELGSSCRHKPSTLLCKQTKK